MQAKEDIPITNLVHGRVEVDALSRRLLPLLDGRHDLDDLVVILEADPAARSAMMSGESGEAASKQGSEGIRQEISARLARLARAALLLA